LLGLDIHPQKDDSGFKMIELGDNVYQLFAQLGNAVPVVFISSIFLVLLYFGIKMCSTKIATLEKEEMNLMEREHEELKDKEMTLLVSRGGGGGGGSSNSSDRGEDRGSGKTEAEEQNNHVEIVLKEETRKETAIVQKKPKRTVCQRKTLRVFSTLCIVFPPLVLLALTGTLLGGIMCNFQSNVDAFGVLLVDANTSVGLVSSGTSGSGNGGNCTVTTTTTTTTTTMTTTGSTTTSSVTSYNVVDSPTMCQALNSSSDGATISGSPPGLMCNGMVMVGWLPDLWASLGEEEQQQATSSNTTTTNSASSSTWGLTNTNVIAPSIPLAFLIMIEHMINVNLYAGLIHDHPSVDNNLELFALGTTNIVASLFSSFGKYMRCVCVTLEFVCVLFVLIRHHGYGLLFSCVFFLFQLRAMVFPEHP